MMCQNCGENEANVKYTQIINGVKKEINVCSECAEKLGINDMINDVELPINFNSFLGDFFNDYVESNSNHLLERKVTKCPNCGLTYDEFLNNGEFGCEECYNSFSNAIDLVLKKLHGSSKHTGRKPGKQLENSTIKIENKKEEKEETNKTENKKQELERELEKAIKEERYEDAAKIRDELKEVE